MLILRKQTGFNSTARGPKLLAVSAFVCLAILFAMVSVAIAAEPKQDPPSASVGKDHHSAAASAPEPKQPAQLQTPQNLDPVLPRKPTSGHEAAVEPHDPASRFDPGQRGKAPPPLKKTEAAHVREQADEELAAAAAAIEQEHLLNVQAQIEAARRFRQEKKFIQANTILVSVLETNAPVEMKRTALYELGLSAQEDQKLPRAQQIFSQYLAHYSEDPSVPEVLLRQGLIYREMGAHNLALAKFYAVMGTALNLKLDKLNYYQRLVLQAQTEIADTYYLQGKYFDASDFFGRLLKLDSSDLNKALIHYKLVRSLSYQTNQAATVAQAQRFLELHANSGDVPEVRFMLASALKQLGRNRDAMQQVLLLLQSQLAAAGQNPEAWAYWQQRAGNEIGNQLYKEGDYINALEIYLNLAEINKNPAWQLPLWYQIGLIYERLQQPQKAIETYSRILARKPELKDAAATLSLQAVLEMAQWRKDHMFWMDKSMAATLSVQSTLLTNKISATP